MNRTNMVNDYLVREGISPSYHRIKVLEYLLSHRNHPTAEMVYKELHKRIPTLSKTTVYNSLSLFAEKGLIKALNIDGDKVRYDAFTEPHAHFKCVKCGNVYDVELGGDMFSSLEEEVKRVVRQHDVKSIEVFSYGVCEKCRRIEKPES